MESAALPAATDHPGSWHNLSEWTHRLQHAVNVTKIAPSLEDLVWAGPRMVKRLGSFIPFHDSFEAFAQTDIPEATDNIFHGSDSPSAAAAALAAAASALDMDRMQDPEHAAGVGQDAPVRSSAFSMEGAKGLGSVFSYATSKWALSCIAMAVILNRTYIFAATRRRLRLDWPVRLLLRFAPIFLLLLQATRLLQSIRCQTSPDFSEMRWGDASKNSDLMFTQNGGLLYAISSAWLVGSSDRDSCLAVRMVPSDDPTSGDSLQGSLSILWPLFGTLCLSQFIETVSCAVQGRPVAAETGMTLFEHSLAFAEADAAISNQLGWAAFSPMNGEDSSSAAGAAIAISRSMVLKRVNTPPEVLLVALLSVLSHLTSHILGVFNLQSKFRLVNTGFWGLCFMGSLVWSAATFSFDDPNAQGLLRYPTVCIIGFVPHVLVLGGIMICIGIYSLALFLSAMTLPNSDPGTRLSLRGRLWNAHQNMQANMSLSDVRLGREMDFYTALLRTGFGAISMASEAVYLNEDRDVNLKTRTWLEDDRFREMEDLRMQWIGLHASDPRLDSTGTVGLIPVKDGQGIASNGYARERAAQKLPKARSGERRLRDGVGATERSGRWLMALDFLVNTNRLVLRAWVTGVIRMLSKMGIRAPNWLLWTIRKPKQPEGSTKRSKRGSSSPSGNATGSKASSSSGEKEVKIPHRDNVDVEREFRQHEWIGSSSWAPVDESELDTKLYRWWLTGGWWGSEDRSGNYAPPTTLDDDDDDTTSLISFATDSEQDDNEWESEPDEGQRTPTQRSPGVSREATPVDDTPMKPSDLARLLSPTSPEEKEEAHNLAAHLRSNTIMTRAQYRLWQQRQRLDILHPHGASGMSRAGRARLSPDEEAELLEQLILSRRRPASGDGSGGSPMAWSDGAAGMGEGAPQCVVCQCTPRTVIVWPCRCLSLCDDCRVSLAMNNFDKCVCCRREVISFSRIFVP